MIWGIVLVLIYVANLYNNYRIELFNRVFSPVSLLAYVMMITLTSLLILVFLYSGGLEGVAEDIETSASNNLTNESLLGMATFLMLAFGGVGLFVRRDFAQALERLGLTKIGWLELGKGVLFAVAAYLLVILLSILWQLLVDPETYAQQRVASDALFRLYSSSLGLGLLVSTTAAVGEEILYRGALQPVFGIPLTAMFFVVMHTQYLFAPSSLIILAVALILAYVRQRYNTTTAIVTHFCYNAIPFVLISLVGVP